MMRNLTEENLAKLFHSIERSTQSRQVADFFERCCTTLRDELVAYEKLQQTRVLSVIFRYSWLIERLSLLVCFTIIGLLLGYSELEPDRDAQTLLPAHVIDSYTRLGVLLIVLNVFLTVNFFFGSLTVFREEQWNQFQEDSNKSAIRASKKFGGVIAPNIVDAKANLATVERIAYDIYFALQCPGLYKFGLFLLLAIIGFGGSPVAYAAHALQIVFISPALYAVVESVTSNVRALGLLFLLFILFLLIFAMAAYYHLSAMFNNDMVGDGTCDTSLVRCFLGGFLTKAALFGGGIAELASPPVYAKPSMYYGRLFFDFILWLVVLLVILNLVLAVIVDKAQSLRAAREEVEHETHTKCFICGLARGELDMATGGFDEHIQRQHNLASYLAFIIHASLVKETEQTGPEGFVCSCIAMHDPAFFPVGRALCLEEGRHRGGGGGGVASVGAEAAAAVAAAAAATAAENMNENNSNNFNQTFSRGAATDHQGGGNNNLSKAHSSNAAEQQQQHQQQRNNSNNADAFSPLLNNSSFGGVVAESEAAMATAMSAGSGAEQQERQQHERQGVEELKQRIQRLEDLIIDLSNKVAK